jgi:hypothetical protein
MGASFSTLMNRHKFIVDVLSESVSSPLLLTIEGRYVELVDRMTIVCSLLLVDQSIVSVDPYTAVVMRYRKGKDFSVELLLAFHRSIKLDNASDRKGRAVSILSIGNVKRSGAAFYLARQEWEVHPPCDHKEGYVCEAADARLQFLALLLCKCRRLESDGIVRLRTGGQRAVLIHSTLHSHFQSEFPGG